MPARMIPLMGQSKALLRIEEGDSRGALVLSPPCAGALYLIGPQAQALPARLDEAGRGSLALPFSPVAALVYSGDSFPLSGGFAGRTDFLERAKLAVRIQVSASAVSFQQAPAPQQEEPPQQAAEPGPNPSGAPVQQPAQSCRRKPCPSLPIIAAGGAQQKFCPPPPSPQPIVAPPPVDMPPPDIVPQADTQPDIQPPAEAQASACPPPEEPPGPVSLAGQRAQSEALVEALRKARELFHEDAPQQPPRPSSSPGPVSIPNPFPRSFPQCTWRRVNYPGGLGHYLSGEGTGRAGPYTVYALPGEYAPVPRRGKGFNRFLRATDGGGYWVRIVRKPAKPPS